MTGPQLVAFWNEHCEKANKPPVSGKFRTLTEGRDRCYHLAWELNMLEGGEGEVITGNAQDGDKGMTATQAETMVNANSLPAVDQADYGDSDQPEYDNGWKQPKDDAEVITETTTVDAPSTVAGSTVEDTLPGPSSEDEGAGDFNTPPLIGRLKLRVGTNKERLALRLAQSAGGYVSHDDLVKATYGEEASTKDYITHLRMVIKGVKVALTKYAPEHELRAERGSVGIFLKDQGE